MGYGLTACVDVAPAAGGPVPQHGAGQGGAGAVPAAAAVGGRHRLLHHAAAKAQGTLEIVYGQGFQAQK